ncbi:MAG: ADP-dependent NAD(P)H-hydrate dehydratase [Acidobacteriota bacterium]|nr:ADP-dependent NAD(P)H-hydrate dehydratase [Acidobacteriota bacterium]
MASKKSRRDARGDETRNARPLVITRKVLGAWPLPQPADDDDKEARGRVLVIGGSTEIAGAVVLAATAALRAGAGKMQIATCRSLAPHVSMAVPEARVIGLPETSEGGIAAGAVKQLEEELAGAQAVLVGPGMVDKAATARLMRNLLPLIGHATLVLDAGAFAFLKSTPQGLARLGGRVVLTPHAGEMASLLGIEKDEVEAETLQTVRRAVATLGAVVALKGRETLIAAPASRNVYCNRAGNVGLATSGSGDTLSGVVAGLAARGATPFQAAVWGVHLHARAGDELARRMGPLGFLARELLAEIPTLMAKLNRPKAR